MADFCSQCSIAVFGEDFGDMAGLLSEAEDKQGFMVTVLCEGCGPIQVNGSGECMSADCLEQHGKKESSDGN